MEVCGISHLGDPDISFDSEKVAALNIDSYTLNDIEDAIKQPLRDYRDQFEGALLKSDVLEISDLKIGDSLSGTVRNVVDFGAFVDIGLHEDGLVHVTRMSMKRINHPSEVVSVGDIVTVYVAGIDEARGRVQLSLLPPDALAARSANRSKPRDDRRKQQKKNGQKPQQSKKKEDDYTYEDAMKKLLERFGKQR